MPIATPEAYRQMLDTAKSNGFAFPAVNCVGSEAVNAALKGFADAGSDGTVQISTGGAATSTASISRATSPSNPRCWVAASRLPPKS
jgi:fructose/tagatose bisphosphate aldolase